jgi:hypothetical protein
MKYRNADATYRTRSYIEKTFKNILTSDRIVLI